MKCCKTIREDCLFLQVMHLFFLFAKSRVLGSMPSGSCPRHFGKDECRKKSLRTTTAEGPVNHIIVFSINQKRTDSNSFSNEKRLRYVFDKKRPFFKSLKTYLDYGVRA